MPQARPRTPVPGAVPAAAAGAFLLLIAVSWRYGYHRDELYFLAAGSDHLAWGFVDQPPLAPALAAAADAVLGATPASIRALPALAMSATVGLTALVSRELGGGRTGQAIAAVAAATVPVWLGSAHLLSTTPFDVLAWAALLYLFVRIINRNQQRLWIAAGFVAGIGLLNKWNVAFLLLAMLVGLLLNRQGRVLANRWALIGAVLGLGIWLPNLLWQSANSWPSLEMLGNLHDENVNDGVQAVFIPSQILYVGPALLPVWIAGLIRLLRNPADRPYRAIAFAYLLLFAWFLMSAGKPYYLSGLYVPLLAAGSIAVENWLSRGSGPLRSKRGVIAAILVLGIPGILISLPILPEKTVGSTGLVAINYDLGEQVGWPGMVDQIAAVYRRLPASERADAVILTGNYGEAGAIDRYGPAAGLPGAFSGQNSYSSWGPPPGTRSSAVIAVGFDQSYLERFFRRCRIEDRLDNGFGIDDDERGEAVARCASQRLPWTETWPRLRHYG